MNDRIPFLQRDFSKHEFYNIDTRDFYCSVSDRPEKQKDIKILSKYPRFFYTEEEVISILTKLYIESGGEGEWRFLSLTGSGKKYSDNWGLKYLRIYRTYYGLIIRNAHDEAIPKTTFDNPINKEVLNFIKPHGQNCNS